MTIKVEYRRSIDGPWFQMKPIRIGSAPNNSGTPDQYLLLECDGLPSLRIDAYKSPEEIFVFNEALVWHRFLVIGWGDNVYLVDMKSTWVTKYFLGSYFGHIYSDDTSLLIASCERLCRIHFDSSLLWTSETLGIDGVIVGNVADGIIEGDGEWDPPGGWRPFRIRLDNGQCVV